MKSIVIFTISVLFSCVCNAEPREVIEKFSKSLIKIIKNSDVAEFTKIGCVKIPCGNIGVDYILGENESSAKFKEIMSRKDIAFKILGPYTIEQEYPDATYSIVFHSPSNSPFSAEGDITMDCGYNELYKSFLQTQVTIVGGKVLFQRVPFYLESHHPYVGDYG